MIDFSCSFKRSVAVLISWINFYTSVFYFSVWNFHFCLLLTLCWISCLSVPFRSWWLAVCRLMNWLLSEKVNSGFDGDKLFVNWSTLNVSCGVGLGFYWICVIFCSFSLLMISCLWVNDWFRRIVLDLLVRTFYCLL